MKRFARAIAAFAFLVSADVSGSTLGSASSRPTATRLDPPASSVVAGSILVHPHDGKAIVIPGAHRVRVLADGTERWDFDDALDGGSTLERVRALRSRGEYDVEADAWRTAQKIPDDPDYPKQWSLPLVHADAAWDVTIGDPSLVVAVVDTGIVDHPDLRDRVIPGYDFITDPDNAGDGDERDPDPHDAGDESVSSSGFHGTHVAGIIGAASGNGEGVAGVDWLCAIQPVRVLGVEGRRGRDSDIADAIRWAAGVNVPGVPENQTPAKVINLSFGGPGYSQVLQDAVLAALARGSIVIASAGNDADDATNNVPGALEGVVSVAAAGPDGNLAEYSNVGPRVDFMTPGGALFLDTPTDEDTPTAILSTSFLRDQGQYVYAFEAGTSQAAAFASGVAALVRAAAPEMRPEVVAAVMRRASSIPAAGCDAGCGAGLIDAQKAVLYARQIAVAECGSLGCGDAPFAPAPLRPEEGCAVGRGGASSAGSIALVAIAVLAIAFARRRGRPFARAVVVAALLSCSGKDAERQGESAQLPLTVRIVDPVPTLSSNGDLELSLGPDGLAIDADVAPADRLEALSLHSASDEGDFTFGTLAHPPFHFFLPADAAGPDGRSFVCLTALDDTGGTAQTCFYAVK